eukprot:scaffold201187_cov52-Prasinocladus_malaysianus.AAC.1
MAKSSSEITGKHYSFPEGVCGGSGFEMAIKRMEVGTQMRVIVPPALGPPVGPSTFFSAKQCEVSNP